MVENSWKLFTKYTTESLRKLCAMQFEPSHRTVVFPKEFIIIRFGSLERDYSLSKGDMT